MSLPFQYLFLSDSCLYRCVDLTIGNVDAIAKTAFVGALTACDPRIAPLIRAVKCWARNVGAQGDDPSDGVNSFALSLMVFHWMQVCFYLPLHFF